MNLAHYLGVPQWVVYLLLPLVMVALTRVASNPPGGKPKPPRDG